ncbi:MAG: prepilin-type N-terminal cleavage/methylation domain-containing protein [Eubacterium sp.]|nr:prepilin-type N-terminal cleavage/methylation domain-containing protein [Eubacterium sp.]
MKENRRQMREGFSLIELVIAIAILAIFVGITSLSVALLRSADTKGLANGINNSLTDLKAKTESHTGPYYLHIYKNDNGFYANFSDKPDFAGAAAGDERLGAASMTVSADSGDKISGSTVCTVQIRKKDGAYVMGPKSLSVSKSEDSPAEYIVKLAKDTGLHYIEQQ